LAIAGGEGFDAMPPRVGAAAESVAGAAASVDLGRQRRHLDPQAAARLAALKMEAASELGLLEKVRAVGWGGLSAKEAGRVGGYVTRVLRGLRSDGEDGPGAPGEDR
jgi:small acid-soluble spore protein F (minor alpha/beta-type SASP)